MEKLKKISDQLKSQSTTDVGNIVNDIIANTEEAKNELPTVREDIFNAMYKDYFTGKDVKENDSRGALWLKLSGSQFNPVNIVNESGKIVDTVPALANKVNVDEKAMEAINVNSLNDTYAKKKSGLPFEAKAYMQHTTKVIGDNIHVDDAATKEWGEFIKRIDDPKDAKKEPSNDDNVVVDVDDLVIT